MKRPALVTVTAAAQSVIAALVIALSVYLLVLTRSAEIRTNKDAPEVIKGLLIAAAVTGGWAMLASIVSVGLWRKWRWGWWLALVFNALTAALILSDSIDGSTGSKFIDRVMYFLRDFEEWSPAIIFIGIVTVLLLPSVRRFYFGSQLAVADDKPAAAVVSGPQ